MAKSEVQRNWGGYVGCVREKDFVEGKNMRLMMLTMEKMEMKGSTGTGRKRGTSEGFCTGTSCHVYSSENWERCP